MDKDKVKQQETEFVQESPLDAEAQRRIALLKKRMNITDDAFGDLREITQKHESEAAKISIPDPEAFLKEYLKKQY
ncbi:MAG: hypothetical protein GX964_06640 [Syntrophomonadaceae bacterium]|jgi:hypothetical protein|nr:hypothetical protein [Syntrophomonadaceae bacterium]